MDEVATQLATISGLRVEKQPPSGTVSPPAAVVSFPEDITFDATYGRGSDRMTLPVVVVVGRVVDRSAKAEMGAYANGSGTRSIKQVVEAGTYTAFDTVRVTGVTFDVIDIAGIGYLGGTFSLDIVGSGD
jgi:hypothetical protein